MYNGLIFLKLYKILDKTAIELKPPLKSSFILPILGDYNYCWTLDGM